MSTIVSEFTTQLTAANAAPGVIAIGLLIFLLIEIEVVRAIKQEHVKGLFSVLRTIVFPLVLVYGIWMATRFFDLIQ